MGHYKSNLRDIEFNLFEVLGRGDVLGSGPYAELDADTAREMLREVARLSEHELAESFEDSDRHPPVYDPATQAVTMPESFKKSFQAYRDSGFWAIDLQAELGGTVAPPSLRWGVNEMLLGSNPAVSMFAASYGFAKLLYALGNEEQKKLAQLIVDNGWHCTMVLTEPDAGSDVGADGGADLVDRHRVDLQRHAANAPYGAHCHTCAQRRRDEVWSGAALAGASPLPRPAMTTRQQRRRRPLPSRRASASPAPAPMTSTSARCVSRDACR